MKIIKKIFAIYFLTILLFASIGNSVFCAIDEEYPVEAVDSVVADDTSNTIAKVVLYDPLAYMGYYVAWGIETLLSMIGTIGQDRVTPYTDAIIFNAVPALDINFINPNENSFIGNESAQKIFKKLYNTTFYLTLTLFGLGVVITGIKLATTTITEQKAQYKEKIFSVLQCFLIVFLLHYFISFIFYLNETLVEAASMIAIKNSSEFTVRIRQRRCKSEFNRIA